MEGTGSSAAPRPFRRLLALGVAVVALSAGCGDGGSSLDEESTSDPDGSSGGEPDGSRENADGDQGAAREAGFDECGSIGVDELAAAMGVDAMYITARRASPESEGGWRTACTYFIEDQVGTEGLTIDTYTSTDAERHFAGFDDREEVEELPALGDRAEVAASTIQGTTSHIIEIRAIEGTTGLHLRYIYNESPGGMPQADGTMLGQIAATAFANLPQDFEVTADLAEGPCAELDLASPEQVLGGELTAGRSVLGDSGAMSCDFAGEGAALSVVVVTDPGQVQSMQVPAEAANVPELGDGANVFVNTEGGEPVLLATVNAGDRVVVVEATFGPDVAVADTQPEHLSMLNALVEEAAG